MSNQVQSNHLSLVVLMGDIGGTNLRFELVEIKTGQKQPTKLFKKDTLKLKDYDSFDKAIKSFLDGQVQPKIAVLAIAGPVNDNTVLMSNAEHWGLLSGEDLAQKLNLQSFIFLNDFEAIGYGISALQEKDLIHVNNVPVHQHKLKLIIGPGTGLGTAMLFPAPFRKRFRNYVIPGEGGHINFAASNQQQRQFYKFLLTQLKVDHLPLERTFCGPAIPYMFKFYASKYPQREQSKKTPTSQQIVKEGLLLPESLSRKSLDLFLQIYSNFIGDSMIRSLSYGGVYLVGSLTNGVAQLIVNPQTNFLKEYQEQRPYLKSVFDRVPIVISKEQDLGLKGTFVYARRIIFDLFEQHK